MHSASSRPVHGVSVAVLRTTVLPATSAAPLGPPDSANGKFHGLITAHTPYGRKMEMLVALKPASGSRPISLIKPPLRSMVSQE